MFARCLPTTKILIINNLNRKDLLFYVHNQTYPLIRLFKIKRITF